APERYTDLLQYVGRELVGAGRSLSLAHRPSTIGYDVRRLYDLDADGGRTRGRRHADGESRRCGGREHRDPCRHGWRDRGRSSAQERRETVSMSEEDRSCGPAVISSGGVVMTTADRLNAFQITRADLNAVLDMVARLGAMPSSDFEETVMELYRRDPGRGQAVYHRLWALVHAASSDRALAWLRPDQASRRMREIML